MGEEGQAANHHNHPGLEAAVEEDQEAVSAQHPWSEYVDDEEQEENQDEAFNQALVENILEEDEPMSEDQAPDFQLIADESDMRLTSSPSNQHPEPGTSTATPMDTTESEQGQQQGYHHP